MAGSFRSALGETAMPADYKQLTAYLRQMGIEKVPHTQKNYLAHLVAVYNLMREHGQDEELCRAGLFHSIYGTEKFQGFKLTLDRREELTQLIGPHAERLAYWNCLMDRASLDSQLDQAEGPYQIKNRETGETMDLSRQEYDDLCSVHLFDWLEQAPRSRFGLDYRRQAYRKMAERVGGAAITAYENVFSAAATDDKVTR
jgi:(p)ppGpp synthase/HD superfamily hydrolase